MNSPVVSIICLAYNHEKYIREALDGFVMQKTDFPFEIIVHDDASTDSTTAIIKEYEAKFPHIFRPIYQKENQHSKERGRVTRIVFQAARGKYIAMCEGDDYWTDPLKLQRQVDFLEENEEYAMVADNTNVFDERYNIKYTFSQIKVAYDVTIENMLQGRRFHTASILFRKNLLILPHNLSDFPFGDTLLFIIMGQMGKVRCFPNISVVYRRNENGVSTGSNRYKWAKQVEKFNLLINQYLDNKYPIIINRNISRQYFSAFKWSLKIGKVDLAFKSLYKFLQYKK